MCGCVWELGWFWGVDVCRVWYVLWKFHYRLILHLECFLCFSLLETFNSQVIKNVDIRISTKILSMLSKLANSCLCVGIYLCISRTSAMSPIVGPYSAIPVLHTLYNIYLQLSESVLFSNILWKSLNEHFGQPNRIIFTLPSSFLSKYASQFGHLPADLQSKQVTANVRLDDDLSAGVDFDYSQF